MHTMIFGSKYRTQDLLTKRNVSLLRLYTLCNASVLHFTIVYNYNSIRGSVAYCYGLPTGIYNTIVTELHC